MMFSTYCHHILDFNSLKHTSYQSLSNPTILSWDMFCMFSEGGKKCSRLHETNPQDDHNKEKGLVLLTLFWGNKYISTEGKAYVTPYLFSLGYYPLRSSQNPIPIMGFKHLDRWPGNFQNSKILKWSLFFYTEMTFYATLSTFQVLWDSDPTTASNKLSVIVIRKGGRGNSASPVGVQYTCKIGFSG